MRPSLIAVLACLALSVACDNSGDSSTSPTQVLRTTDTITGTVQPMSAESHNFIVMQGGQVDVTLTAAGPPATIFMGLGVGSPSTTDGTCVFGNGAGVSVATQAGSTPQITGTVQPMSSDSHNFIVMQAGQVDVTLTAAGPPATIFMGLGVGTPSTTDGTCIFGNGAGVSVATQAGSTPQITGGASGAGTYCVSVFDIGNQTAAVDYTVTVTHP